jgi:uncharacterized Ntn-hydrolase superfamily protein
MTTATFSIVAVDRESGEIGIAVASKVLAVGAVVPWALAGVGAVATQAWTNVTYGPEGLRLLAEGLPPDQALARLVEADAHRDRRQAGIVDGQGRAAAWTGRRCSPWAGHRTGDGFTCQGNLLAGPGVIDAMAEAFASGGGPLAARLVAALAAGQAQGGDRRGQQSAALLVVSDQGGPLGLNDRRIDLRADDAGESPIAELGRLLEIHRRVRPPQSLIDEFVAAGHGNQGRIQALAEQYPLLVHARARWDETALEAAAHVGNRAIAEWLLAQGAPLDVYTAAVIGMEDRVAEFIRTDPALARGTGVHGLPAMYFPAITGQIGIAEMLLRAGGDVNAGRGGNTPLHGAARFGRTPMAEWLLDRGADPAALDYQGKTPLAVAVDAGQEAVASILRRRGATA